MPELYAKVAAGGRDDARIAVHAAVDGFPVWDLRHDLTRFQP